MLIRIGTLLLLHLVTGQPFPFKADELAEPSYAADDNSSGYPPIFAVAAAGFGMSIIAGAFVILKQRQLREINPSSSASNASSQESFSIDLTTGDSCIMEDVVISVEFLPSSPSSVSSNKQETKAALN